MKPRTDPDVAAPDKILEEVLERIYADRTP